MATTTKQAKQFQEIASEVPTKGHKTRHNQKSQSQNFSIMNNSTNEDLIKLGQKQDERNEQKETILQASKNGNDSNEPKNGNDSNEQKTLVSLKDFATDMFNDCETFILRELCLNCLQYALMQVYGTQKGKFVYFGFCRETENGKFSYANNVDETIKNDSETKEVSYTITKGTTTTKYQYFRYVGETCTTIASIIARFNAWFNYNKKINNVYVREILNEERKNASETKAQKAIENIDEDTAYKLLAEKLGVTVEMIKALKK